MLEFFGMDDCVDQVTRSGDEDDEDGDIHLSLRCER